MGAGSAVITLNDYRLLPEKREAYHSSTATYVSV